MDDSFLQTPTSKLGNRSGNAIRTMIAHLTHSSPPIRIVVFGKGVRQRNVVRGGSAPKKIDRKHPIDSLYRAVNAVKRNLEQFMESQHRYSWRAAGDVNAYFGLLLDNLAGLLLTVGLLVGGFGMPADFVVGSMVPGTAIGVLVGDLLYTLLAFRLAKKTGRSDVTAMPLGLDTPSIFGITIFVIGPAFLSAKAGGAAPLEAARIAWGIGIASMVYSGIFKLFCSVLGLGFGNSSRERGCLDP